MIYSLVLESTAILGTMDSGGWGALGTWVAIIPTIWAAYLTWRDREKTQMIKALQEHQREMAKQTNQLSQQVSALEGIRSTLVDGVSTLSQSADIAGQRRLASIRPHLVAEDEQLMSDHKERHHQLINKGGLAKDFSYDLSKAVGLLIKRMPPGLPRDADFVLQVYTLQQFPFAYSIDLRYKDEDGNEYKQTLTYSGIGTTDLTEPLLIKKAGV